MRRALYPAAVNGDEVVQPQAFRQAFRELENRIKIFISLPIGKLDCLRLPKHLDDIGNTRLFDKRALPAD